VDSGMKEIKKAAEKQLITKCFLGFLDGKKVKNK
jgi:hypothetical protein